MATKKDKLQTFYVSARILSSVNLPIKAESLEQALEQSKSLKSDDFVEILGEWLDSEMIIDGIYKEYKQIEL